LFKKFKKTGSAKASFLAATFVNLFIRFVQAIFLFAN